MTIDKLRKRLGLEPFKKFQQKARGRNILAKHTFPTEDAARKYRYRQTGRTTETLIRALSAASRGEDTVVLVPSNQVYAKAIEHLLKDMAAKVDLSGALKNISIEVIKLSRDYDSAYLDHLLP